MRTEINGAGSAPSPEQQADAAALRMLLERVAQLAARLSAIVARAMEVDRLRHGSARSPESALPTRPALTAAAPAPAAPPALPALPALPAPPSPPSHAPPSPPSHAPQSPQSPQPDRPDRPTRPAPAPPLPDDPRHRLTPRERQVFDLVADGLSSKEIARSLGIARATARCHVQNVLTKLGVASRVHAAALAHRTAAGLPVASDRFRDLTHRETEVLRALASGLGQREIAARLYLSPHTVRTHVQRLLAKLDAHSVLGALALARRAGLAPAEAPIGGPG